MGGSDVAGASWRGSAVGFGAGGSIVSFFFFQAEDGIRDKLVTGVQTCALPICPAVRRGQSCFRFRRARPSTLRQKRGTGCRRGREDGIRCALTSGRRSTSGSGPPRSGSGANKIGRASCRERV